MLALLVVAIAGTAAAPADSPAFPPSSVCGHCAPPKSEGPIHGTHTWFTQTAGFAFGVAGGLATGAAFGRKEVSGIGSSPGEVFHSGKPLIAWGGAGALLLVKTFTHAREEPPPVTAPWRQLRPPSFFDQALRNGTGGRLSPKARRVFDSASYWTLGHLVAQPLGLAMSGARRPDRWQDALIPAEAGLVSLLAVDQVKHLVHRPRPFAYYCEPRDDKDLDGAEAQLSFFSGHTSVAFALAAATAAVASRRQLPNAVAIRRLSYSVAGTTGLLRVMADRHYASDVLVGAAVGWLTGRSLARWHAGALPPPQKGARAAPVSMSFPTPGGGLFQARFGDGFSVSLTVVR